MHNTDNGPQTAFATTFRLSVKWTDQSHGFHAAADFNASVQLILRDPSCYVKRAVLPGITRLSAFFGRRLTDDTLLPILITLLNDPDWQARQQQPSLPPVILASLSVLARACLRVERS